MHLCQPSHVCAYSMPLQRFECVFLPFILKHIKVFCLLLKNSLEDQQTEAKISHFNMKCTYTYSYFTINFFPSFSSYFNCVSSLKKKRKNLKFLSCFYTFIIKKQNQVYFSIIQFTFTCSSNLKNKYVVMNSKYFVSVIF